MDEPVKLSQKQQQVLRFLREGKPPQEIAKKMKTSRSAVYGHMARMKGKGVDLPDHEAVNNTTVNNTSGNGRSGNGGPTAAARPFDVDDAFQSDIADVEERTRAAIEDIDGRAQQRLAEIKAERTTLQERLAVLNRSEETVNIAVERAKRVEEALA